MLLASYLVGHFDWPARERSDWLYALKSPFPSNYLCGCTNTNNQFRWTCLLDPANNVSYIVGFFLGMQMALGQAREWIWEKTSCHPEVAQICSWEGQSGAGVVRDPWREEQLSTGPGDWLVWVILVLLLLDKTLASVHYTLCHIVCAGTGYMCFYSSLLWENEVPA